MVPRMTGRIARFLGCLQLAATTAAMAVPQLTVNGVPSDYTTTKLFIDEVKGESRALDLVVQPDPGTVVVEAFSNLNRRDRANADADGDGIEDGIHPPDPDLVTATNPVHYYAAHPLAPGTNGAYTGRLVANRCGAYRLTLRWKVSGDPAWRYLRDSGVRDHAVVVSPPETRDMCVYEFNVLTVEANQKLGGPFIERSTFEDLWDAPNASRTTDLRAFNFDYLAGLGVNWSYLQPIHPVAVDGRELDGDGQPYSPGSPYAVKNFFEVSPWMTIDYAAGGDEGQGRADAMAAFQTYMARADEAGMQVMLDAPFNHTGFDCELGPVGVALLQPDGQSWAATDEIRDRDPRFFSRANDYCQRATSSADVAPAPDRVDFGKWNDVKDVYFGRYSALTCQAGDEGAHRNEDDIFHYDDPNWLAADFVQGGRPRNTTRRAWRYFAEYALYWLERTGVPAGADLHTEATRHLGLDGLRCDFAQGLPPQAWEYMVNVCRTRKWNFVWLCESLDGGPVTYRSNRHFDLLNENVVFEFQNAVGAGDFRRVFEDRRGAYGQGAVLLNTSSHDEENYVDPWHAALRHAALGSMDGAPMIFMGQELGISRDFGFTHYELNSNKTIPHFKRFNSMWPAWEDQNYGLDQLYNVYAGVNAARKACPSLRGPHRYFLDRVAGGLRDEILSVAKYERPAASPATSDVVFAFALLDRDQPHSDTFKVDVDLGAGNLFGLRPGRRYNVRNPAAYAGVDPDRPRRWLWPAARDGQDVIDNGVFVSLNPVPASDADWATAPFEAQYLKLYDVTPPPAPTPPCAPAPWVSGEVATFCWNPPAGGPDDVVTGYVLRVGTAPGAADVLADLPVGTGLCHSVTGAIGQTLHASVTAVSQAGVASTVSVCGVGVQLLDPGGDPDDDGFTTGEEAKLGTDALDPASHFRIVDMRHLGAGRFRLGYDTAAGCRYGGEFSDDFTTAPTNHVWTVFGPAGVFDETEADPPTRALLDSQAAGDTGGPVAGPGRVYRIRAQPVP